MLLLRTNVRGQVLKGVLLLLLGSALHALLTYSIPAAPPDGAVWLLYLTLVPLAYLFVVLGASCWAIIRVRLDPAAGTVTFRRGWSTTTVPLAALTGYRVLTYWSVRNGTGPPGWVLETRDGRRFKLEPLNLLDLPRLEGALTALGVPYRAPERST